MKIFYVILDGVGDRPIEDFDGKTPLEAAVTPHIDKLAKEGKTGLILPVGEGIAPESDVAVISILGYDAEKYYTGRGPLESYAEGLDIQDGDLAYRVNFATIEKDSDNLIDRRVGRNLTTEEAKALGEEINQKVKLSTCNADFWFRPTIGHRGVLVIRSYDGALTHAVSNTDPAYGKHGLFGVAKETFEHKLQRCVPDKGYENDETAKRAADLTNEFIEKARKVLDESEINKQRILSGKLSGNVILTRDAGDSLPKFPKLPDIHNIRFSSLVEMPVERGIALLTGMKIIEVPPPTKDQKSDYELRVKRVLENMDDFDLVYIHLKGPDEPAHDGNFELKKESIELIDKHFFGNLLPRLDLSQVIFAVTGDHSTPCEIKAHSDDPVPLLVFGKGCDATSCFGESEAKNGEIGTILGKEVLSLLL
ncbi:MAG: alkaline phosphatase family protein [Candidatus Saelkia tenebricola]|nr:alkaline phosphatase family protein [Candidatus Saelkia tenebricola]